MKITTDIKFKVIESYKRGLSYKDIAGIYGISGSSVLTILNNSVRVKKISPNKKYSFNENYFDKIDTEDKAYFLGLLMADGYNSKEGFLLSLKADDIDILESFAKHLNYDGSIKYIKKRKYCSLNIYSKHVSESLDKLGVISNKTHFTKMPFLDKSLYKHFIRGIFDGDGCIYYLKSLKMSIVGNSDLIRPIQKYLDESLNIGLSALQKCSSVNNIVRMQYYGQKADKILNWLYKDANVYLKRKQDKYLKFKNKEL